MTWVFVIVHSGRSPAATAKRLSNKLNQMLTVAIASAVATTVVGSWLALWLHCETGPVIVTLATGCFLVTFLRRP
jgi:ABC-type Mn2+/Zn2+ transport system permease subunit